MTNEEAKQLLHCYRSNGSDADDAHLAEALKQAHLDPQLGEWFKRQREMDALITSKLSAVPVPGDLRASILSGAQLQERRRSSPLTWAAVAAALILGLGLAFLRYGHGDGRESQLAAFSLEDVQHGTHGGKGEVLASVQQHLSDPSRSLLQALPASIDLLARDGCRTLRVGGQEVVEICFLRGETVLHLYAMASGESGATQPTYHSSGALTAVTWSDGSRLYSLVGDKPPADFARLL